MQAVYHPETPMQTLCYYFGIVFFYVVLPVLELTMYARLTLKPEIHLQPTLEVWDKRLQLSGLTQAGFLILTNSYRLCYSLVYPH